MLSDPARTARSRPLSSCMAPMISCSRSRASVIVTGSSQRPAARRQGACGPDRDGVGNVGIGEQRVCAAEHLVFVAAGAVHRLDDLISDASRRQGGERSAARSPDIDRAPQTDPGLLSEILRVTASRQPLAATNGPDQRLIIGGRVRRGRADRRAGRRAATPVRGGRPVGLEAERSCPRTLITALVSSNLLARQARHGPGTPVHDSVHSARVGPGVAGRGRDAAEDRWPDACLRFAAADVEGRVEFGLRPIRRSARYLPPRTIPG